VRWEPIHKTAAFAAPDFDGYDVVRQETSCDRARSLLDGLPEGRGVNIAHEAVHRHAAGPRRDVVALRCIGSRKGRSSSPMASCEARQRFANLLRETGCGPGKAGVLGMGRCAGGMLVGADYPGVDRHGPPRPFRGVGITAQLIQDALPGAVAGPAAMPVVGSLPVAVLRWQIPPRHPGPGPPEHPVDHLPVVCPPAAAARDPVRQQRLQSGLLLINQIMTIKHTDDLPNPRRKIHRSPSPRPLHPWAVRPHRSRHNRRAHAAPLWDQSSEPPCETGLVRVWGRGSGSVVTSGPANGPDRRLPPADSGPADRGGEGGPGETAGQEGHGDVPPERRIGGQRDPHRKPDLLGHFHRQWGVRGYEYLEQIAP
jgi:hypothetical protein